MKPSSQGPDDQFSQSDSFSLPSPPPPPVTSQPMGYPPGGEGTYNPHSQMGVSDTQYSTMRPAYKLDPTPPDVEQKPRNVWRTIALVLAILVVLLGASTGLLLNRQFSAASAPTPQPTTAAITQPTVQPDATPIGTTPTVAATSTTAASPVAAQPSATAAAGTIPENITLGCGGCNDPIRVKINSIQIDTANGRMVWNLTLTDITGSNLNYTMYQFSLEANASQTQIPATFTQPSGSLVTNTPTDIQAVFAFVPFHNMTYTLTAIVNYGSALTTFDPVKVTF